MELLCFMGASAESTAGFDLFISVRLGKWSLSTGQLTISWMATVVINAQKRMMPIVSILVRP